MAEEVTMTPVDAAEPPKSNPLAKPPVPKPAVAGAPATGLKPGLKLPPKPGATVALKPGLKLPPKPGTVTGLKPGLKLPTQTALKPGLKLPPKPVIRKPGATVTAAPLPKPVAPLPKPVAPAAAAPAAAPAKPASAAPVAVDAQGVGKLPTVEATAIGRADVQAPADSKPMETLKSVTQKLKGITQEIPQQAILRKTGIIADVAMSEAQKEAAKHKTARISLSDAMGVAPVKNEAAPMKTIRIKRPVGIPGATGPQAAAPAEAAEKPAEAAAATEAPITPAAAQAPSASVTQRKTLKIARPGGGAVRPAGKFGVKRPSQATTVVAKAPDDAATVVADKAPVAGDAVADIPDIPNMPMAPVQSASPASDGPAWLWSLSSLVQAAACVAMFVLALFLYQNSITNYF